MRSAALLLCAAAAEGALLPIFYMHGINDNHGSFDSMQDRVRAIDPNCTQVSLAVAEDRDSIITNLWQQTDEMMAAVRKQVAANPAVYKNGYAVVCHSQGALNCRVMLQRMDDHNAHTLIALAGPHRGQFGIPGSWQKDIPWGRDLAYSFFLTGPTAKEFQAHLSIANFWNDPRPSSPPFGKPVADYLSGNTFLPAMNNNPARRHQGPGQDKNETEGARYKRNFLRLKNTVFTAGTKDDTIYPWNSGIWEFYTADAKGTVPLAQEPMYTEDWIGLRELNETGRLIFRTAPVNHNDWKYSESLFQQHIMPFLPKAP